MNNKELDQIVTVYESSLLDLNYNSKNPYSIDEFIGKFIGLGLINRTFECFTKKASYDWIPSKGPKTQSEELKDKKMELKRVIKLGEDIYFCYKDSTGTDCFNWIGLTNAKIQYVFIENEVLLLKETSSNNQSGVGYQIYFFQK